MQQNQNDRTICNEVTQPSISETSRMQTDKTHKLHIQSTS